MRAQRLLELLERRIEQVLHLHLHEQHSRRGRRAADAGAGKRRVIEQPQRLRIDVLDRGDIEDTVVDPGMVPQAGGQLDGLLL